MPIPAPDLHDTKITKFTLDNGLTCITAIGPEAGRFFGASVFTPALSVRGEQHVLEHMVVSGSRRFPSPNIYKELQHSSDCYPSACTYHNRTWYYGSAHSDGGLQTLATYTIDALFQPLLTLESFRMESYRLITEEPRGAAAFTYPAGVVFNEMQQGYLHPSNTALRNAIAHLFPEALKQIDFAGSPAGLKKLADSYDDVLAYHQRFYYPENTLFFVAHPTTAAPIVKLLEQLKPSGRSHNYRQPEFEMMPGAREVHATYPVIKGMAEHSSNLVVLFPTEKPHSVKEILFYNLLSNALFYVSPNGYLQRYDKVSSTIVGRPMVAGCRPLLLGAQHFLAIQVDGMAPEDHATVRDLVLSTYKHVGKNNLPFATFEAALASLRHDYTMSSHAVHEAMWPLTEEVDGFPDLNFMTRGAVARQLHANARDLYPQFCRFTEKLFARSPFVYSQDPVPMTVRARPSLSAAPTSLVASGASPWPVRVPEYDLLTKKIAKEAARGFRVEAPFREEGIDQILSIPLGDKNRIHLNIGFALSQLPPDIWTHAIFLLNTLAENRGQFRSKHHAPLRFSALASQPHNQVVPLSRDSSHFLMGVSIFPDDFDRFMGILEKICGYPDYTKDAYMHGLQAQRDSLLPDVYDPRNSDGLADAFRGRALAGSDKGYLHREALVGFDALPRFNRILSAWLHNHFSESEAQMYRAVSYLFTTSAMSFHFSAPPDIEERVARRLRAFYQHQRPWIPGHVYEPSLQLPRNDMLIAPTVTNTAARVYYVPKFSPEYEAALAYIRGYVVSKELNKSRGFYRNFIDADPSGNLIFMAQRGSSSTAPFKVYNKLPEILGSVRFSPRELKGLKMGALTYHLGRLGDEDPYSTMARRARFFSMGRGPVEFLEHAEGILNAGNASFHTFAELLADRQSRARNVLLTGEAGYKEMRDTMKRLRFEKPVRLRMGA